jgi:hypothetical protein
MASFSDSFPSDGDSPGAGWAEQAGCDMDVVSGQLRTMAAGFAEHYAARTGTSLANDQWIKFTLANPAGGANFPRIGFRYTDSSSPFYQVTIDASGATFEWATAASVGGSETAIQGPTLVGGGDGYGTYGMTIEGTGTSTVLRMWRTPSADTPTSVSSWDGASDPADVEFTNNPSSAVNSGPYIAIGGVTSAAQAIRFDNVFGGDFAGGGGGATVYPNFNELHTFIGGENVIS